jgi:hypothetical protein
MTLQTLVVALLVVGCSVYAAWSLMPGAARRAIALRLLKLNPPALFARPLQRAVTKAAGCGCDGCDHAPLRAGAAPAAGDAPAAKEQPIVFQRRVR